MPWTAPRPALARARPPKRLASARSVRAGSLRVALVRAPERASRASEALAGERVDERVGAHRDERLDELRERVEPARRHDVRRQADEQVGVHDGRRRQHARAAQARLDAVLGRGEDGVARDLGAGARRGRNGDERQRRPLERPARGRRPRGSRAGRRRCRGARRSPCPRRSRCRRRTPPRRRAPAARPASHPAPHVVHRRLGGDRERVHRETGDREPARARRRRARERRR